MCKNNDKLHNALNTPHRDIYKIQQILTYKIYIINLMDSKKAINNILNLSLQDLNKLSEKIDIDEELTEICKNTEKLQKLLA